MRRLALCSTIVLLVSCTHTPDSYPVPPQQPPIEGSVKITGNDYVRAGDPNSQSFFVKDVLGSEGSWRWTGANPQFRFSFSETKGRRFQFAFGVNHDIVKQVGPLKFSIYINDHLLEDLTYPTPGDYVFEKPVPAEWLSAEDENIVSIKTHNPWKANDGVLLGLIFNAAGFVE